MSSKYKKLNKKTSLRNRISIGAGLLIFFGIFLSSGLVTWNGFSREISNQIQNLKGTAKVFSSTIAEPMSEGKKRQVQLSLTSIGKFSGYEYVKVAKSDGSLFTEMGFGSYLSNEDDGFQSNDPFDFIARDRVWISDNIIKSGETIGKISILANVTEIKKGLINNVMLNLFSSILFSVFAYLICYRFISNITLPLYNMSLKMEAFVENPSPSVRADEDHKGELGILARSFNSMMDGIAERDATLLNHQRNLEKTVQERTADLVVAKRKAEQANDAKSDFLSTMSHEIRTPMNGMLVMAELLATAELKPRYRRYAEIVLKSGNGLLTIINDILDFSKIQSGKMSVESIDVDLRLIVEDVTNLFWQQMNEKGLELGCEIDEDVPRFIKGDPTRLNQIVSNLLNNALKFTESGQISIHISLAQNDENLRIEVRDTGIGIAKDKVKTIFEEFNQADQSTTREYGGTGLGLAICKKLVEAMDGKIWIESEVDVGSSFIFELPLNGIEISQTISVPRPENLEKFGLTLLALPPSLKRELIAARLKSWNVDFVALDQSRFETEKLEPYQVIISDIDFYQQHYFTNESQVRIALSKLGDTDLENLIAGSAVHDVIMEPVSSFGICEVLHRAVSAETKDIINSIFESQFSNKYPDYSDKLVLVAEDAAVNREVIQQALRQFNIEPIFAVNGIEAKKLYQERLFDLVFIDCNMPKLNGFDATMQIRKIEKNSGRDRVPIVALTAHIANQVKEQITEVDMDGIVIKPFTMKSLQNTLSEWFGDGKNLTEIVAPIERGTIEEECAEFDKTLLDEIRAIAGDGYEATISQLRTLYLDSAPDVFENLKMAYDQRDHKEMVGQAHGLKSMSLNIAAKRFADQLQALELVQENSDYSREFELVEDSYVKLIGNLTELVRKSTKKAPKSKTA